MDVGHWPIVVSWSSSGTAGEYEHDARQPDDLPEGRIDEVLVALRSNRTTLRDGAVARIRRRGLSQVERGASTCETIQLGAGEAQPAAKALLKVIDKAPAALRVLT